MHESRPPGQTLAHRLVLANAFLLGACVVGAVVASTAWPKSALLAAAFIAPLLLPLPGLLRRDRRTHAWATLCVTPYFIYGVTEAVANPLARPMAAAVLFASLALCIALVAYLRLTRPAASRQGDSGP